MKMRAIFQSQASHFLRMRPTRGTPYLPDVREHINSRYGFLESPQTLEEFNDTKGMTFLHGKFAPGGDEAKAAAITKFQIFEQGFYAETRATVEFAEAFLDDFLSWGAIQFGMEFLDYPPVRKLYGSQIEFQSEIDFAPLLEPIRFVGKEISSHLERYGQAGPPFTPTGFSFHCGPMSEQDGQPAPPTPSIFTFERAGRYPQNANIFVSWAPLKTADHVAVIEEIEAAQRGRRSR